MEGDQKSYRDIPITWLTKKKVSQWLYSKILVAMRLKLNTSSCAKLFCKTWDLSINNIFLYRLLNDLLKHNSGKKNIPKFSMQKMKYNILYKLINLYEFELIRQQFIFICGKSKCSVPDYRNSIKI